MGLKRQRPDGGEDDIDLDEQLLNLLPDELRDSDEIYLDDEVEPPRGRGGILAIMFGILFGLVVAGVAAWYLLGGGMGGMDDGTGAPPVVTADGQPYKTRPEEPGGMMVENKDKLVYNRIAEGDGAVRPEEKLLPEAEQPVAPPAAPTTTASGSMSEPATMPETTSGSMAEPAEPPPAPEPPALVAGTPPVKAPAPPAPAPEPPAAAPEPASKVPAPPAAVEPDVPDAPAPAPAPAPASTAPVPPSPVEPAAAKPEPVAPAAVPASTAGAKGDTLIQVAALRSEADAEKAWVGIQGKHKDLLGSFPHRVVRADLGDKGIYFRLRVGPVGTAAEAKALCKSLDSRGQGCLVVK